MNAAKWPGFCKLLWCRQLFEEVLMEEIIQEALSKGVEMHVAGEFDLASQLYESVIKLQPNHADANHNMGLLKLDMGNDLEALPYLQTALQLDTSIAQFWLSYMKVLINLERLDEASRILDLAKESGFEGEVFCDLQHSINFPTALDAVTEEEVVTTLPKQSFTFIGNSQLINSIIKRYGSLETYHDVNQNWNDSSSFYSGSFLYKNVEQSFLTCNMGYIGHATYNYENYEVSVSEQLGKLIEGVDKSLAPIVIMLRGNELAGCSLVDAAPRWDFSTHSSPPAYGRQFVNKRDVEIYFHNIISPIIATCAFVKHKCTGRRVYYVFPPQIPTDSQILKNPEIFGDLIRIYGIVPKNIRKKIYEELYLLTKKYLDQLGIILIETPKICVDMDGCLKEKYASGCLHGNELYGELLMRHLWKFEYGEK